MNLTVSQEYSFNKTIEKVWYALADAENLWKWVIGKSKRISLELVRFFRLIIRIL